MESSGLTFCFKKHARILKENEAIQEMGETFFEPEKKIQRNNIFDNTETVSNQTLEEPFTTENQDECLASTLTPLHNLPYSDQLKMKRKQNVTVLNSLQNMLDESETLIGRKIHLRCNVRNVVPSPVIEAYRNKDEFRVHVGVDGNPKTVGFFVGRFTDKTARCINVDSLIITKQQHKQVANHFQNFIRQSPLAAYDMIDGNSGYWRGITVRSNVRDELMAIVSMHPQELTQDEIDNQKNQVASYFQSLTDCKIISMYFQARKYKRSSNVEAPYELLFGEKYLYEEMLGLSFRISPGSFFQSNTQAAGCLYRTIYELSKVNENSTVVDICCGTGTISLTLAPKVHSVIGIDTNKEAVEDAKINAEINSCKNAMFVNANAEAILPTLFTSLQLKNVTVVMNPTRSGIANSVIDSLRKCKQVERIVYISCKSDGAALHNFMRLCLPTSPKNKGDCFTPTVAVPVDMFPHTNLSELIVVFDRVRVDNVKVAKLKKKHSKGKVIL